jgi:2-polyprenyl-6-methoxyphenol hydroxylase-like FAD-dependent oxidoreductase
MENRAIVIGGSIAGLLTAQVLRRWFGEVLIIDRDQLSGPATHRKGTPQSKHAHGLLARGLKVIEELVPGYSAELTARGAVSADLLGDVLWYNDGHLVRRGPSDLDGLMASRPLIESTLRDMVTALPEVKVLDGVAVTGLLAKGNRLTGVRTEDGEYAADLVVDASGRSNRGAAWLAELGYAAASEDVVKAGIIYSTRQYRHDPEAQDFRGVISGHYPANPVGCGVGANENNTWLVTLVGFTDDPPPALPGAFEDYAARLDGPELHRMVSKAEPLSDPVRFRIGPSVRRRYENCDRLPEGFVATGDSLCCFNPAYGQGMTIAALTAQWLGECLEKSSDDLTKRYFRGAAKLVGPAWELSTSADLRFPQVEGKRTAMQKVLNGYIGYLHRAGEVDPVVGLQFLRVANLLAGPESLLAPRILWRVMRGQFSRSK